MVPTGSRKYGDLALVRVLGRGRSVARVRLGIFSGRRGSGLWPTEQRMVRFPADVRSPITTAVMNGGAAWSSDQERRGPVRPQVQPEAAIARPLASRYVADTDSPAGWTSGGQPRRAVA
jgi:hypothetical protein